jgi:hypothetical protein
VMQVAIRAQQMKWRRSADDGRPNSATARAVHSSSVLTAIVREEAIREGSPAGRAIAATLGSPGSTSAFMTGFDLRVKWQSDQCVCLRD